MPPTARPGKRRNSLHPLSRASRIISGSVLMRRNGEEIGRQSQGDAFGVWALLDDEPRLTTAEAREETRLLFVSRDDFYEMLSGHLEVVEGIMKHLAQRLRRIASVIEK